MTFAVELIEVGDSVGFVFPDEVLAALALKEGDLIDLTESPQGFHLSPHNAAGTATGQS